ncbi:type IV pilus twitching motility protein PilT [Clostridium tertium]|uniref:type IV pilus twitching motility protein PilT n=1 Tax=Clostridium tertium TaxID=1559 RepID=UPI0023B2D730|nr:ATPase, T2SS/T4P/T4SS family [Clostridium tertium]
MDNVPINVVTLMKIAISNESYMYKISDKDSLTSDDINYLKNQNPLKYGDFDFSVYSNKDDLYLCRYSSNCIKLLDMYIASNSRLCSFTEQQAKYILNSFKINQQGIKLAIHGNEIVEITYKDKTYINKFRADSTFIKYAASKGSGIILVNENNEVLDKHIEVIAKSLNKTYNVAETSEDKKELINKQGISIIKAFDYKDDYELLADLLSQDRMIVVALSKYNNERLINAFVSKLPGHLKTNLIENLLGAYTYYNLKDKKKIRHEFVAAMYNLKLDLHQDNFSEKSIQLSNQLFNTETKMLQEVRTTFLDLPAEKYLRTIIAKAKELNASDISLSVGQPPLVRIGDDLIPIEMPESPDKATILSVKLGPNTMSKFTEAVVTTKLQKDNFNKDNQVDSAYSLTGNEPGSGRFRVSTYRQRDSIAMSFRILKRMDDKSSPDKALNLKECGVPEIIVSKLDSIKKGLVIFTGPVNTGKSTVMNAIIDHYNQTRRAKIITIEDPIETLHSSNRCLIEQREVGIDCNSFEDGLKQALRSDPDMINVGEIRNKYAALAAMQAARSGHIIMTTFHTPDSTQTLNGILQLFEPAERQNVMNILRDELVMIYSQQLIPSLKGNKLLPTQEILLNCNAFKAEIFKENANFQSIIQNNARDGMISMDKSIANLYLKGQISLENANLFAHKKDTLQQYIVAGGGKLNI